jgi:3-isopropylmalate/(R)-2-methylmalate dehydratase small subunit
VADRFVTINGAAAPLLRRNIDTDTISPGSSRPGSIAGPQAARKGSSLLPGELFANWRYDEAGRELPDFVLNQPPFRNARILLAGENFGCGSSRESAVWLLKEWGIRCIVAPSFGEIFYDNCFANAVLPLILPDVLVRELADEAAPGAPSAAFTVDLAAGALIAPSGRTIRFSLPGFRRRALLEGLDQIAITLEDRATIESFWHRLCEAYPWAYRLGEVIKGSARSDGGK